MDENPCIRKIGVRKFYKQKNLEENKWLSVFNYLIFCAYFLIFLSDLII
jgi:hypothetical protein